MGKSIVGYLKWLYRKVASHSEDIQFGCSFFGGVVLALFSFIFGFSHASKYGLDIITALLLFLGIPTGILILGYAFYMIDESDN